MSDIRAGRLIRELRRRRRLRQRDLADLAGLSQQTVSLVERGQFEGLSVAAVRRVAGCVDGDLPFEARYRGALGDRLLDSRHAALAEEVVRRLRGGWEVFAEYGFNHYGERGSVDLLAWHPRLRTLLIIEIKTELADLQEMLRSLDRKRRLVPAAISRERGWKIAFVGLVVVLPATSTMHAAVARHASLFDATLPSRTVSIRRWTAEPSGDLRGIWFLQSTHDRGAKSAPVAPHRVRRSARDDGEGAPRSNDRHSGPRGARDEAPDGRDAT